MMRRRESLTTIAALALTSTAIGRARAADGELRIGYQKYGTLTLLKERGTLEERLARDDVEVTWIEFPGGPQLLEAMNVGAIDFGTTGEAPPIFAQAAGAPLLYVGFEPPAPKGEALLVPANSPLTSIADLRGRRVALNKGSNVHYLLVRALEANGLAVTDITPVYLPPADARAAFESGRVDAWVIWDPFLAAAEAATGARQLFDGTGLVDNHQFFLAAKPFAQARPEIVRAVIEELDATDRWAKDDQAAAAAQVAPRIGIPAPILEVALARFSYGVRPLTDEVVAAQQKIADTFHRIGLIPKAIVVKDALWRAGA